MVTLSRFYLRGVREGESRPHLLPHGAAAAGAAGALPPALTWARYPGPAFLGLPTHFPAVSGRARAGLDRAAEEPWGPGAAELAESFSAGLEGFEAAPCPLSSSRSTERPGRALPEGGGFSRGPARPRGRAVPPPPPARLLPSQPGVPRPGSPRRGPGMGGCGCAECGPRAGLQPPKCQVQLVTR